MSIILISTMASNILYKVSLLSCLLLLTSSLQPSSAISKPSPPDSSAKVRVRIYYQSIGNADYMNLFLAQIVTNKLIPIVDLHLSPWGNSQILSNGTFVCQGGKDECELNTIEACAIDVWPEVAKHVSFIHCVEFMAITKNNWQVCFDIAGFDRKPIEECCKSGRGKELEFKYANETAALKPPCEFTPWVVVDGKPIYEDFLNLLSRICEAYKGSSPPDACQRPSSIANPSNKPNVVQLNLAKAAKFP